MPQKMMSSRKVSNDGISISNDKEFHVPDFDAVAQHPKLGVPTVVELSTEEQTFCQFFGISMQVVKRGGSPSSPRRFAQSIFFGCSIF
jgi:hypothetical protein